MKRQKHSDEIKKEWVITYREWGKTFLHWAGIAAAIALSHGQVAAAIDVITKLFHLSR